MVHPFERILSDEDCQKGDDQRSGRRCFLKLAAGGAVAAVAGRAFGEVASTLVLGEEGGRGKRPPVRTTRAVGEEGGGPGIIAVPGNARSVMVYSRNFHNALRAGDVETAGENLKKIEQANVKAKGAYKSLVASLKKLLERKLNTMLFMANKNLKAGKLVPAIKSCRAISRINGFKQQDAAKAKLEEVAKLEGYDAAFKEVQAQELYDTAAKAKDCDKLKIYEQVAKEYGETPTGKKVAQQAKALAVRIKRNEAAAAELLKRARKAKGSARTRMLRTIVMKYRDTPSGKTAAEMLKKAPVAKPIRPVRPGGGPIATTLAIGEEG